MHTNKRSVVRLANVSKGVANKNKMDDILQSSKHQSISLETEVTERLVFEKHIPILLPAGALLWRTDVDRLAQLFDAALIYDWSVCDWLCVKAGVANRGKRVGLRRTDRRLAQRQEPLACWLELAGVK